MKTNSIATIQFAKKFGLALLVLSIETVSAGAFGQTAYDKPTESQTFAGQFTNASMVPWMGMMPHRSSPAKVAVKRERCLLPEQCPFQADPFLRVSASLAGAPDSSIGTTIGFYVAVDKYVVGGVYNIEVCLMPMNSFDVPVDSIASDDLCGANGKGWVKGAALTENGWSTVTLAGGPQAHQRLELSAQMSVKDLSQSHYVFHVRTKGGQFDRAVPFSIQKERNLGLN